MKVNNDVQTLLGRYVRTTHRTPSDQIRLLQEFLTNPSEIQLQQLKKMVAEAEGEQPMKVDRLAKVDKPVETRERGTLLTIIAALCKHTKIKHEQRGAAQRIREMTEVIGARIDDGTIAKVLAQIPDALESRMK